MEDECGCGTTIKSPISKIKLIRGLQMKGKLRKREKTWWKRQRYRKKNERNENQKLYAA